jgi:hypothetical protein
MTKSKYGYSHIAALGQVVLPVCKEVTSKQSQEWRMHVLGTYVE